jgi:molybdenum cofactor cytidylyltransferase
MQNVGAVILAAGGSFRFGSPKQLAQFRGKTLVRRVVDVAQQAGCSPVVVVTGSNAEKISRETTTAVVENQSWREGIGTSIRVGVEHLIGFEPEIAAIVLLVCDQPFIDASLIRHLIALREKTGKDIVASSYSDTVGVPAIFARPVFSELRALEGDSGAKKIIFTHRERLAEVPFPRGNVDIDTLDDYENLIRETEIAFR